LKTIRRICAKFFQGLGEKTLITTCFEEQCTRPLKWISLFWKHLLPENSMTTFQKIVVRKNFVSRSSLGINLRSPRTSLYPSADAYVLSHVSSGKTSFCAKKIWKTFACEADWVWFSIESLLAGLHDHFNWGRLVNIEAFFHPILFLFSILKAFYSLFTWSKQKWLFGRLLSSQSEQSEMFSKSSDWLKKAGPPWSHFCFNHVNRLLITFVWLEKGHDRNKSASIEVIM